MNNYEIAKDLIEKPNVEELLNRGIVSLNIYIFIKRYERYRMYSQVFGKMEAMEKAATDMKCDCRTIRRAIDWCEME